MKELKYNILKLVTLFVLFIVSACSTTGPVVPDALEGDHCSQVPAIKEQGGYYKVGKPYVIYGTRYYPEEDYSYSQTGMASWYGEAFHAKKTANGEDYDMDTLTVAHRTLPMPSVVKVTNLENGRSLVMRVNDRGPYAKSRIIDISKRGATLLGFKSQGVAKVRVEILEDESKALKAAMLGDEYTPYANSSAVASNNTVESLKLYGAGDKRSGDFFVQSGAYSEKNTANELRTRLHELSSTNVSSVNAGGRELYRVRSGPFASKGEAENVLAKIKNIGVYDAKIVQD